MAIRAETYEIAELIGLDVVVVFSRNIAEGPKRDDVVNIQFTTNFSLRYTTLLATIAVAFASGTRLLFPIRSAIARLIASLPRRMIWPGSVFALPLACASFIAKLFLVIAQAIRLAHQKNAACRARHFDTTEVWMRR